MSSNETYIIYNICHQMKQIYNIMSFYRTTTNKQKYNIISSTEYHKTN